MIGNKWDVAKEQDESQTLIIPSFKEYLSLKNIKSYNIDNNHFTNRIFFNWINEINWAKVAKTTEDYGHLF
jgi:hypothetical protein